MDKKEIVAGALKTYCKTSEYEKMRQEIFVILQSTQNKEDLATLIIEKVVEVSFDVGLVVISQITKMADEYGQAGEEWKRG